MPCPAKSVTTEKPAALGGLLHGARDIANPIADLRLLDSRVERRASDAQQASARSEILPTATVRAASP